MSRRTARRDRADRRTAESSDRNDLVTLLPPLPANLTRDEAIARMEELYARLPRLICRGLCHSTCTQIPATELEYQRIEEAGVSIRLRLPKLGEDVPDCAALGPLRNCTVYALRPAVCRAYGVVEDLRCVHGCVPTQVMSRSEFISIRRQLEQLSRHVTGKRASIF